MWLSLIIYLVTHLPSIIKDVQAILDFIGGLDNSILAAQIKGELFKALRCGDTKAVLNIKAKYVDAVPSPSQPVEEE
jgi:hypothetical protein